MLRRQKAQVEVEEGRPTLSFGDWSRLPVSPRTVVQVCHPDWRGVRTAAYAFGSPVVEVGDLESWSGELVPSLVAAGVDLIVIQGWPLGAAPFARGCKQAGIEVKVVLHSSPALQAEVPAEAEVVTAVFRLRQEGVVSEVAMVKAGVAEGFAAGGHEVTYLPNRTPDVEGATPIDLGGGLHVGIFGANWWPKNLATQFMAAIQLPNAVIHLNDRLGMEYLDWQAVVVHGELSRKEFLDLMASVDVNLYATLTECHPLIPIESYLLGVPCLVSRTSAVFSDDPELWDLTSVDRADDPLAIRQAAMRLLEHKEEAVERARMWIVRWDDIAAQAWLRFTGEAGDA